jgi:acyl carrier protein
MERDAILTQIKTYMTDLFGTEPGSITLDADLGEDLDLDSIDAVDLIVKLQELTGRKIKAEEFKTVRTVRDVVERVYDLTRADEI